MTILQEMVRERIEDIDEVRGYLIGNCPFHATEERRTFLVNPTGEKYHCLSCNAQGDAADLFRRMYKCTRKEAVHHINMSYGIDMVHMETPSRELYQLMRDAANYYKWKLSSDYGEKARAYLNARKLTESTKDAFQLGFATEYGSRLYDRMKKLGYQEEILMASGLFTAKEGKVYDKFFNRLIFPICDEKGNVIGFGGRVLDASEPKYLNSPETSLFSKRETLFAIDKAVRSTSSYFVLCEGYMDVISMHQAGYTNAVASLGTALTLDQCYLLSKYKSKVLLAYDSDEAGKKATEKALALTEMAGLDAYVLNLGDCKDPDEFIKVNGVMKFHDAVRSAVQGPCYEEANLRAAGSFEKLVKKMARVACY